jgi:Family of unknown function (DUF5681)
MKFLHEADEAMPFQPGQSGNPKGRQKGFRPTRTKHQLVEIEKHDGPVSLPFLVSVAANQKLPMPYRLTAAGLALPYEFARKTARKISEPLDLPAPTSIEQATANIAKLGELAAAGKIALDEANDLIGYQKAYIESQASTDTENRLRALEAALHNHDIRPMRDIEVLDGMPPMPGCEGIIMPPRVLTGPVTPGAPLGSADRDSEGDGQ